MADYSLKDVLYAKPGDYDRAVSQQNEIYSSDPRVSEINRIIAEGRASSPQEALAQIQLEERQNAANQNNLLNNASNLVGQDISRGLSNVGNWLGGRFNDGLIPAAIRKIKQLPDSSVEAWQNNNGFNNAASPRTQMFMAYKSRYPNLSDSAVYQIMQNAGKTNTNTSDNNLGISDEDLAGLNAEVAADTVGNAPAPIPSLPVTGREKESSELSRIDELINSLKPSDKDREFNRRMALANMFFKIASSKEPTFFGAVGKGMSESIPDVTKAYSKYTPEVSLNQANLLSKLASDKLEREKMAADIDYKNRYLDVLKSNKSNVGTDKSANYYKGLAQLNYQQAKNIRAANVDVMGKVIDPAKEMEAKKYEDMADQYSNAAASALGFVAPAESNQSNTDTILDFDTATGTFK